MKNGHFRRNSNDNSNRPMNVEYIVKYIIFMNDDLPTNFDKV